MSKTVQWSVATPPEVKDVLSRLAQQERRSLSSLGGLLLEQALQARGCVPAESLPAGDQLRAPASGHSRQLGVPELP